MLPNTRTAVLLTTLALSWFVALPKGAAQEQVKQDENTVRISTELVQIDVGVKDQQGKLVRDLRREDFEVLEDGKPQPLTHFAVGTASRAAVYLDPSRGNSARPGERAGVTSEGRHIVLAVDDYHLAAENLAAAKSALAHFVEHELAPGDKVALTATSGVMNLNQQFTSRRSIILRAISQLNLQDRTGNDQGGVPNLSDYQAELIEQGDQGALQIAVEELRVRKGKEVRGSNSGRIRLSNPNDAEESVVRARARSIVAQNDRYTALTFAALETTIRGLRELPGRKILLLVSDGFFTGEGRKFDAFDIRRITDAATRAGVVIYSIDARGLVARPTLGSASERQNSTITAAPDARRRVVQGEIRAKIEGLYTLAKETGGLPFYNNNDLGAGLKRALDDTEFYYVLAYEPTNTTRDGRFRKIEVRVASRPGLTTQTRAGYFAPLDEAVAVAGRKKEKPPKKPAPELADTKVNRYRAALNSLIPLRGIPFDLGAHFIHTPATGSLAMITARIDSGSLRLEPEGGFLEVVGLILDEAGKSVGNFSHSFELKGGADSPTAQKYLNYHNLMPLGPGTYQVRLVVADGDMRRIGSATEWIEIPDLKQRSLALSSIFLTEEGKDLSDIYDAFAATLQPQEAKKNAPAQTSSAIHPARRFERGTNLDFLMFAYNAQTNPQGVGNLSIRIKVLANGTAIYTSPPSGVAINTDHAQQGFPCVARLPLGTYDPGEYELQIEVSDQTAKLTATRSVSFSIE